MRFLCNPQCVGWCVLVQYLESDKNAVSTDAVLISGERIIG